MYLHLEIQDRWSWSSLEKWLTWYLINSLFKITLRLLSFSIKNLFIDPNVIYYCMILLWFHILCDKITPEKPLNSFHCSSNLSDLAVSWNLNDSLQMTQLIFIVAAASSSINYNQIILIWLMIHQSFLTLRQAGFVNKQADLLWSLWRFIL